jgi:hypothetical protein
MAHMGVLNDYLAYLPMVCNSSMAVEGTKKCNVPFNEADLAGIVWNSPPVSWMNQYIRSAKQDDVYGASNIILSCPGS